MVEYQYDDKSNLTEARRFGADSISEATGDAVWKFAYNPSANNDPKYRHLLESIESPNSTPEQPQITTYEYDLTAVNYPVKKIVMPEGVTNTFARSISGLGNIRTVVTDGNGRTTDYQSDQLCDTTNPPTVNYQCRTTTISAPLSATTEIRWNAYGNKLYERDAEGMTTAVRYDENSNPIETTVAGGAETITTQQTFEAKFNRVTSTRDGRGKTTNYTIDPGTGDVRAVELPTGSRVLLSYDPKGNLTERTDEAGYKTKLTNYDSIGNPRTVERETSIGEFAATALEYDGRGRLLTSADSIGTNQTNSYDAFDRLVSQVTTDPAGFRDQLTVTSRYFPEGQLKEQTTSGAGGQNHKIVNAYDALNRLQTTTETASNATGNVRQFTYDLNSNLVTAQDRRGVTTTRTYNELNFLTSETVSGAFGSTIMTMNATVVDRVGNVRAVKDLTGTETELVYDGLHQLQSRKQRGDLNGTETTYTEAYVYDANGNVTSNKDRNNRETAIEYDSINRPLRKTDALGRITTWNYDDQNKTVMTTTAPQGLTQTVKQDGLGRPTFEQVKFAGKDYRTTHTYDGRRLTTTDARGTVSVTDLSGWNEPGKMTVQNSDPAYTVEMKYSAFGAVKQQKDALQRTTTITQDGFGRQTAINYPGGFTSSTAYDAAGLPTAQTDRRGVNVSISYDNLGRELKKTVPNEGVTIAIETINYLDAERKETRTDANNHTSELAYDGLHRLISLTNADGKTRTLKYDGANLRAESDYKGKFTRYEYDEADRPTKVLDRLGDEGQATVIAHNDSNGYTKTTTDRRGNKRIEKHDALGRLINITDGGLPLAAFEYDQNSNKTVETDGENRRTEFVYDALNRLKTKKNAVGSATAYQEESFAYDAAGNLINYFDGRGAAIVQTVTAQLVFE